MQEEKAFGATDPEETAEQDAFGWDINPNLELQTTETGVEEVRKIFNCLPNVHCAGLPVQSPFLGIENRRQKSDGQLYCQTQNFETSAAVIHPASDCLKSTTHDLFELLERVQSSRLDDQRCVLPAYFKVS